jgi:hypothetical protein
MVVTKANSGGSLGARPQSETDATIGALTGQTGERGGKPKPGGSKDGRLAGNEGGKGKTLKTPGAKKGKK